MSPSPRVVIRPYTYRGVAGYLVRSRAGGIYGTSIHVETRRAAERVKSRIKAGEDVTLEDMTL